MNCKCRDKYNIQDYLDKEILIPTDVRVKLCDDCNSLCWKWNTLLRMRAIK